MRILYFFKQKFISNLPRNIIKKIHALRKLQCDTSLLEAEFHHKVFELQKEFEEKHSVNFEKRKLIIRYFEIFKYFLFFCIQRKKKPFSGDYEPTEEECDFSIPILSPEIEQKLNESNNRQQQEIQEKYESGIPDFWLTVLKYSMESLVKEQDEPALKVCKIKLNGNFYYNLNFKLYNKLFIFSFLVIAFSRYPKHICN